MSLTKVMAKDIDKRLNSKYWRMTRLYKIVTKDRKLTQFKFNEEQKLLFDQYMVSRKEDKRLREFQLKNRQIGMTTFHAIWMLDECCFYPNQNCAIIAHDKGALERIFTMVKTAWLNMPDELRPQATRENKRELFFPATNSTIFITLKARSGTLSHLHISEYAFIRDVRELKAGSFQAANMGDITIEFTANGLNHAYTDWTDDIAVWRKHFFSWLDHKEYTTDEHYPGTREHEEYLDKAGATDSQKNWWYSKLDELGEYQLMLQEYPSTADDAFITSNKSVFDVIPDTTEPIREERDAHYVAEIFEEPDGDTGGDYRIGADPSGGYADGDYSCFYILNARTYRVAVRWHGHLAPDLFGKEIEKWACKYNNAFVGIEVNNHGLSTINAIKDTYSELYVRERRDKVTNEVTKEIGWLTTAKSKDELIDGMKSVLRDGDVGVVPKGLQKELRTFVRKENGSIEAEEGCHDDEVMAFGLALMMIKANPYYEIKVKERKYMGR